MDNYICASCGVQFAETESPPDSCPICEDERQFVPEGGQKWTTLETLKSSGYKNEIKEEEPGLIGVGMTPRFTIGQRALLVQTDSGNVMYDCMSYVDDEGVEAVKKLGGIKAMCMSHPHFYDSMVEWSHALGGVPIYIPEADRKWVMRPDPVIQDWDGKPFEILPGVTLIQCGGHFEGSAVLHWSKGAEGRGAIFVGDNLQPVLDRSYIGFTYSIVNLIPMSIPQVDGVMKSLAPFKFDRIYSGWFGRDRKTGGQEIMKRSYDRYLGMIRGTYL